MVRQDSIADICKKFEHWRSTRKNHREQIPESLWESAAALTKKHSVHVVAKSLRLNHRALKEKVEEYYGPQLLKTPPPMEFLELSCEAPSTSNECIIELDDQKSTRMRISLKGCSTLDIPGLLASFWERCR